MAEFYVGKVEENISIFAKSPHSGRQTLTHNQFDHFDYADWLYDGPACV